MCKIVFCRILISIMLLKFQRTAEETTIATTITIVVEDAVPEEGLTSLQTAK